MVIIQTMEMKAARVGHFMIRQYISNFWPSGMIESLRVRTSAKMKYSMEAIKTEIQASPVRNALILSMPQSTKVS